MIIEYFPDMAKGMGPKSHKPNKSQARYIRNSLLEKL